MLEDNTANGVAAVGGRGSPRGTPRGRGVLGRGTDSAVITKTNCIAFNTKTTNICG